MILHTYIYECFIKPMVFLLAIHVTVPLTYHTQIMPQRDEPDTSCNDSVCILILPSLDLLCTYLLTAYNVDWLQEISVTLFSP